eukprot:981587-Prorocentrum_minimum.AAC.3
MAVAALVGTELVILRVAAEVADEANKRDRETDPRDCSCELSLRFAERCSASAVSVEGGGSGSWVI